jgi:hypothetical protein
MPRPRPPEFPDKERIVTVSVRYPESVLVSLRARAKAEERALNTVIVRAARDYLATPLTGLAQAEPVSKRKAGGK